MKQPIFIALIAAAILSGCTMKEVINPDGSTNFNNSTSGSTPSTTNSDSYQPVTKGSVWTYNLEVVGVQAVEKLTLTMTGDKKTVNGKTYYKATSVTGSQSSDGYFSHNGSLYTTYSEDTPVDETVEEVYMDDSVPAGGTFNVQGRFGSTDDINVRYKGTVLEKGVTKTINGKTYKNVIHTRIEAQYSYAGGDFGTQDVNEYYVAKGVGLIEADAYLGTLLIIKQTLTSYNIK